MAAIGIWIGVIGDTGAGKVGAGGGLPPQPDPPDPGDTIPNNALAIDGRGLLIDGRFVIIA